MMRVGALSAALLMMLAEWWVSQRNERWLIAHGAVRPADPVYPTMRWAYPVTFAALTAAGLIGIPHPVTATLTGLVIFAGAKVLKVWAITALGRRWTYRIFLLPGAPLVDSGPYRWLRHPNYVGVMGEMAGFALIVGATAFSLVPIIFFAGLLRRRIRAEDEALRAHVESMRTPQP